MFERYTEKARRVIFFSRFEASHYASPLIESHHLLLGLLREDRALALRCFGSPEGIETLRKRVDERFPPGTAISTSVDLPLSAECKRVLAYAAAEAGTLSHRHITPEHLLAGLLRETGSFAAELLRDAGMTLDSVRQSLQAATPSIGLAQPPHAEITRQELHALVDGLEEPRLAAAARLLDALAWERVAIAVAGSGGSFSLSL